MNVFLAETYGLDKVAYIVVANSLHEVEALVREEGGIVPDFGCVYQLPELTITSEFRKQISNRTDLYDKGGFVLQTI